MNMIKIFGVYVAPSELMKYVINEIKYMKKFINIVRSK